MKVKQEDFRLFTILKNVENEAEMGRFQNLLMFKNVENEGKWGEFLNLPMFKKCGISRWSGKILDFTDV